MTSERQKGSFLLFLVFFRIAGEVFFTTSGFLIYFLSRADILLSQVKVQLRSHQIDKISLEIIGIFGRELQNWVLYHQEYFGQELSGNGDPQLLELLSASPQQAQEQWEQCIFKMHSKFMLYIGTDQDFQDQLLKFFFKYIGILHNEL